MQTIFKRCCAGSTLILALELFAARVASGATFYVSPTGNDSNSGDFGHPFKTIQRAVDGSASSAKAGDTVIVGAGAYRPNPANYGYTTVQVNVSGTEEDPITIQGYSGVSNVYYGPAILKGSVVVDSNSWTQVSASELSNMGFPAGANIWKVVNWFCATNGGVVKLILNNLRSWQSNPQQVFISTNELVDGTPLSQVAWPSSEFTTPTPDGVGNSFFTGWEFFSLTNLVMELRAHTNVVENYLWTNFTAGGQSILNGNNDANDIWRTTLTTELNMFMYKGPFNAGAFSGVTLSDVTQKLRDHPQLSGSGNEMVKFNRALIQDAFNYELHPGPLQTPQGSRFIYWGLDGFPWNMTNDYSFYYREVAYPTNASISDTSVIYIRLPANVYPTNRVVEVSVANFLLGSARYVKVKNLLFRHSNGTSWDAQTSAVGVGEHGSLENCDVQWLDNTGVSVSPNGLMTKCKISNIGRMGFSLSGAGAVADASYISACNYRLFGIGWECGGTKSAGSSTIQNCEFTANLGPPIWYDFADDLTAPPTLIHNNYIHDNYAPVVQSWAATPENYWTNGGPTWISRGMPMISLEASRNVYVYNNLIISNATKAIFLGTQNCQVFNNIIMYNDGDWVGDGQHPWYPIWGSTDWGRVFQDNQVYYNIFYNNYGGSYLINTNAGVNPANWNIWDYNLYFNSITNQLTFSDGVTPTVYNFALWQQQSGYDQHSVYWDPNLVGPFDMQFALSDFGSIIAGAMRSYENAQDATFAGRLASDELNINSISNSLLGRLSLAGGSLTGPLYLAAGSAGAPSLSFVGDTDTGLFHSQADEIGFATAGTAKWYINGFGTLWSYGSWLWTGGGASLGSGSLSAPSLSFVSEQSMGFYRADTSDLRFTSSGSDRLRVTTNAVEALQNAHIVGTITNDSLSANTALVSGPNKQITSSTVTSTELGNLSGSTGNIQSQINAKLGTGGGTLSGAIQIANGNLNSPSLTFSGDTGVGIYHAGAGTMGISGSVSTEGLLSVDNAASGTALTLGDGSYPLEVFGGNFQAVMADNKTNNAARTFRLGMFSYDLSQAPMTFMGGYVNNASSADLYIGGGTGNAFQNLYFYTATNTPTYAGYQAMRIFNDGAVGIGDGNVSAAGRGNLTVQGKINVGNVTANSALVSDANKNISNSAVTATELGYLSGVTSAVQAQLIAKPNMTVFKKTADQSSTSTTLADVTGLSFSAAANTDYAFEFFVVFQTAATTNGIKLAVNGPSGSTFTYVVRPQVLNTANGTDNFQEQTFVAADGTITTASIDTANTSRIALVQGAVSTGANSGSITLRLGSEVSGSSVLVKKGSWGRSF